MDITILDGSTFVVSDERGDFEAGTGSTSGFFYQDTRHLSRWVLTLDGARPSSLSTDSLEYYFAQFFCAPDTGSIYENPYISVIRKRLVGDGFIERIEVENHRATTQEMVLRLDVDSDFADLFEVKDHKKKKGVVTRTAQDGMLRLDYKRDKFERSTTVRPSIPAEIDEGGLTIKASLQGHETLRFELQVAPSLEHAERVPKHGKGRTEAEPNMRQGLKEWLDQAPKIECSFPAWRRVYTKSLIDLAALRFYPQPDTSPGASVPAAGLPWFMALFGRDSCLVSYQALPFAPELAETTLRILAANQGTKVDLFRDEEPGKILHELRHGELTVLGEMPQSPYFGSSDSTPLWLILLDEYERWTGDAKLVKDLESNARAALHWIDNFGDRDGDGYVEYIRGAKTGLENQCWKDSWNSILFADGTVAEAPRAVCEIQGYVYDAKIRCARLARKIWKDEELAKRLQGEAEDLRRRFHRDFWMPERGYFALALDREKRKVDSITSNVGHLLWSGIVDEALAPQVAKILMGPTLHSGWGIRTMAEGEAGFNPIEYHNGTVWPHDTSLVAAGLARYGFRAEASQLISQLYTAALVFNLRLPEVFAGYARSRTVYPVKYPTASSPQAWASGAPLLGLRVIMGLEPGDKLQVDPHLPPILSSLVLDGIPGRWGKARAEAVRRGGSAIDPLERFFEERSGLWDR